MVRTNEKNSNDAGAEMSGEMTLLQKTRKINRLLQRSESVAYDSVARVLSSVLDANVYITDVKGAIFGYAFIDDFECDLMLDEVINQNAFPKRYAKWLLKMDETSSNLRSKTGRCAYKEDAKCLFNGSKNTTIVPIYGMGERLGTFIVARYAGTFDDDDLILAEYGAAVVGMEMLRDRAKRLEQENRSKAAVHVAIDTLSVSEERAAKSILSALDGKDEGLVVASKIATEVKPKLTPSIVVNTLRKLESAGVIESKSLGMKGTYIKVLNAYIVDEVKNLKNYQVAESVDAEDSLVEDN